MWVAVGLLAGGALGNLADRVRADAVTDFIDSAPGPPSTSPTSRSPLGVVILVWLSRSASRSAGPSASRPMPARSRVSATAAPLVHIDE